MHREVSQCPFQCPAPTTHTHTHTHTHTQAQKDKHTEKHSSVSHEETHGCIGGHLSGSVAERGLQEEGLVPLETQSDTHSGRVALSSATMQDQQETWL